MHTLHLTHTLAGQYALRTADGALCGVFTSAQDAYRTVLQPGGYVRASRWSLWPLCGRYVLTHHTANH